MGLPVVVQTAQYLGSTPEDTRALSFSSTPSTNNIVVAFVLGFWADNTGMSVTDNQGNTYTERDSRVGGTGFYCKVFTCPINTASGTFTVTCDSTGGTANSTYYGISLFELSGADESALVNQTVNASGTSSTVSLNLPNTSVNNCWVAGAIVWEGSPTVTADSPWSALPDNNTNEVVAYRDAVTAGNYDPAWTFSASENWYGVALAIKGADDVPIYGFQGNAFQFGQYVSGGSAGNNGALDQNIGAVTVAATGQVLISGSGAGNVIGAVTSSATGKVEIRGVGANNTIGAVTLSATGDVDIAGSANITVGAITSSATGTVLIKGVGANNTIGDVTLAGTGVIGSSVSGELDQNIGNITLAATGQVLVQGVASNSIGNITLSATGQVEIHGVASVTVGAITSSATGKVNIAGTTNATIGNITVAAVGGVRNVGVLNTTIGDITSSATGTVLLEGELSKTIGNITVSATGVIGTLVVGQLNTSIGIFTLQATGGVSNTVRTIGASIQAGSLGGGLQKRAYSKSRFRQENMKWPSRG